MPNDFAEAHWLLNYRFGFIKRGLVGSVCSLFTKALNFRLTPTIIAILSGIVLCIISSAYFFIFVRTLRRQQPETEILLLGAVFASSPFIVINAHCFGYLDSFLYILTIASVMMLLRRRPILSALFSSVAVLIHESYLLIGLPMLFLTSLVTFQAENKGKNRWMPGVLVIAIPLVVFLLMPLCQSLTTDSAVLGGQIAERMRSFGFVPTRGDWIGECETMSFMAFFRSQRVAFGERLLDDSVLASLGPTLLTILVFVHLSFRIRPLSLFSIILYSVILIPLALHAVAWDVARISSYTINAGFIAWWILAETRKANRAQDAFLLLALPTLVINIFGNVPLMDDVVDRFSTPYRLLFYSPTIVFVLQIIIKNLQKDWLMEFKGNADRR